MGIVKRLVNKEPIEPEPHSIYATVSADDSLILRVVSPSGFSAIEGSSTRLIRSDEYSELLNHREGALVLGCLSTKGYAGHGALHTVSW